MLAIDFGSSNTAAAFRNSRGGVRQISLSSDSWLMPSAVLRSADRTLVGRAAVRSFLTDPDAYEPSPKRRLADRRIHLGPGDVAVTDLVAEVLREVVARAERETGMVPDRVVLTHPDTWAEPMQQMLRDAAMRAGLDRSEIRLISEASAAAWYYTVTQRTVPVGARLAVFDFGAGTCDVAVLDKEPDQLFRVIAADGAEGLGGLDLDARIHGWVRYQLAQIDPQLADDLRHPGAIGSQLTLKDQIRNAKEALSEAATATIAVANGARTQMLTLTRDEFDELISPELDRAVELTERVLAAAQRVRPSATTPTIYLTGGSSVIPAVHQRLSVLGTLGALGDPKTVVSQGALHAMGVLWDDDKSTVHLYRPGDLIADAVTQPAFDSDLPWYLRPKDRPGIGFDDHGDTVVPQQAPDPRVLLGMAPPRVGVGDEVDVSGFSPPFATRGEEFLLQVLIHRPQIPASPHSDAVRRGVRSLAAAVPLGSVIDVHVSVPGVQIGAKVQRARWLGHAETVQFWVHLPAGFAHRRAVVTVAVSCLGRQLGSVQWSLPVETDRRSTMLQAQGEAVARY